MIPLSPKAQQRLDGYLDDMRRSLRGCESLDPADIEQDVLDHIDHELRENAVPTPVESPEIEAVLERLGSPRQWVPQGDVPVWRRLVLALRHGPDDWRLAYLALAAFMLTVLSIRMGRLPFLLTCGIGFLLARAAVEAATEKDGFGPQRWLVYPSLLLVYVPLAIFILFGPAILATNIAPFHGIHAHTSPGEVMMYHVGGHPGWWIRRPDWLMRSALWGQQPYGGNALYRLAFGALVGGAWWVVLAIVVRLAPRLPSRIFYPILGQPGIEKHGRKILIALFTVGLLSALASASLLYLLA
jgi:hypothetical protein